MHRATGAPRHSQHRAHGNGTYRAVFVIDRVGVVRHVHPAVADLSFRPTSELVAAVRTASTPGRPPLTDPLRLCLRRIG